MRVVVIFQRLQAPTRWEQWRHSPTEVIIDDGRWQDLPAAQPRILRDTDGITTTLHAGLHVELFRDEAEGYHLNLSSGAPVWFVMWRQHHEDPARAWPEMVTLSYNEAARLLDAQERVDTVHLQGPVQTWLQAFTDLHYRPEPRQRKRPPSFRSPQERG